MPTKREHIYRRKDGRWEGRYRSGIDKEGKAVYRSVYGKSYGEVKKKLSECKEKDAAVKLPSGNSLLFRDVVFLWKKTNANRYKGATVLKYENLINNHIIPVLGGYKLAEFNTFLLTDFMTEKLTNGRVDRSGGLSASYVRSIMLVVLEIIDFAAAENFCAVPKTKLRKPAPEKKEIEILDANSQRLLEKQLTQHPDETLNKLSLQDVVSDLKTTEFNLPKSKIYMGSRAFYVKKPATVLPYLYGCVGIYTESKVYGYCYHRRKSYYSLQRWCIF